MLGALAELVLFFIIPVPLLICLNLLNKRNFSIKRFVHQLGLPCCCDIFIYTLLTLGFIVYICLLGLMGVVTVQLLIGSSAATVANAVQLVLEWMVIVALNVLLANQISNKCERDDSWKNVWVFLIFAFANFIVTGAYAMQITSVIPGFDKLLMLLMAWNSWVILLGIYMIYLCYCRCR